MVGGEIFAGLQTSRPIGALFKSGHGPHFPPPDPAASPKRLKGDANMDQSGLGTQTANQAKFIPPITSLGPHRRYSLARPVKAFSLTSKSIA